MSAERARFDFTTMAAQGDNAGVPELFVLVMTPVPQSSDSTTVGPPDSPTPLEQHYEYMHGLIVEGKLLLGGPCLSEARRPDDRPVPPGLVILRVASRAAAEDIARNEPFHQLGMRRNTVLSWTPKFGSFIPSLAGYLN